MSIRDEVWGSSLQCRNLIFDWDGTLFDSIPTKRSNFIKVVTDFLGLQNSESGRLALSRTFDEFSGLKRRVVLEHMCAKFEHVLSEDEYQSINSELFTSNKMTLKNCKLFPDALRLLQRLSNLESNVWISSSVPQTELDYFVSLYVPRHLSGVFSGALGSDDRFYKGEPHFAKIELQSKIHRGNFLFIGDDLSDIALGQLSHVPSLLISRHKVAEKRFHFPSTESLDVLCTTV